MWKISPLSLNFGTCQAPNYKGNAHLDDRFLTRERTSSFPVCLCAQYIDLIIFPNCNYNKTGKLFLIPPSPFLCSPVLLLISFLKSSYFFHLQHLLSELPQSPQFGTQQHFFLDTAALVLLSKGRATLLNFFL